MMLMMMIIILITIMDICKAPTPRLKALNIAHVMCFEMENVIHNLMKDIMYT